MAEGNQKDLSDNTLRSALVFSLRNLMTLTVLHMVRSLKHDGSVVHIPQIAHWDLSRPFFLLLQLVKLKITLAQVVRLVGVTCQRVCELLRVAT